MSQRDQTRSAATGPLLTHFTGSTPPRPAGTPDPPAARKYDTAKFTDREIEDELNDRPARHRSDAYLVALRAERDRRSAARRCRSFPGCRDAWPDQPCCKATTNELVDEARSYIVQLAEYRPSDVGEAIALTALERLRSRSAQMEAALREAHKIADQAVHGKAIRFSVCSRIRKLTSEVLDAKPRCRSYPRARRAPGPYRPCDVDRTAQA